MKTRIISIVVMLMVACNVMAQYDFMTLHFNNDSCPSRRFYWPDVTKFTQSKYDKDGELHDSYQTQEIWIRDSIYSYSLMDIDSITFTKFNKEEAKRNFISAMNSTTKLTHGCKTITEVESVLDKLNGSEGVERAWIDGTTLHVTSINGYTIDFYYDLIKPEEIDTDDSEPYNIPEYKLYAPAWVQDYSYTGYKPRVLLINLLTKDEGFFSRNQKLRELEKAFRECKIETRFIEESRPRISSDDVGREETQVWETTLFEYDKIYYCAHGGYRSGLNFHTINLSYEIGRKLLSEPAFEHEVLDAAYESLDIIRSQYENCTDHDIALGCIETTENNIDYSILSPSITENYFGKYATRDFDRDKDPIVFSGSCHTLDGNNNMAQVFLGRGAKVVLGYHNANHTSLYASKYFYEALLKGKTVKDAFSSIPSSYRIEDDDSEEGGILEPRYSNEKYGSNLRLANTFTKDVDFETARAEFISNKKVTISGVTGIVNPSDPDIEYGFRYGILKNDLNKTIKASEHHYSTTEPLGNFSFSAKLDMSEYQNYYYQAYTCYDDSYCYGDIYQIIFYLIKEIYLDPTSATLKVGESLTIKATFNPANPPNKELDWESSDPSIATVSHGIVNAKSVGHATITAKATDGSGVTATCEIEVEDDHVDPITLSQTEVTLALGSTTTVEITSGNGDYTVSVDKPTIAKASVSGTIVTIEGVANGTAKVTVKDKSGQTAEINVNVWDNLTLSQSSVGLYPGNSTTVEITNGSGHYSVSVDKPAVATASLSGSKITIKGVGVGSAVVTVTDTSTNKTAKINVTVSSAPTLVVSNSSVDLFVGGNSTVEITSGSGSYEISNSNTRVVQAVLEGAKITLTAKSEGNAVVTVKDKVTGQTASISVTVNSIANLVLSQSNVNLAIGAEAIVEIVSGSGDYSVAVDKPAVATATLSGTKITIKGIATGTANVTVKDKSGQTAEIKVNVNSSSESYAVYNAGTLTFYHDQLKNSRGGSVYVLNTGENYPGWYDHDNINKVVFDKSFADARPTSAYRWFYEMNNLTSIEGIKNLNTSEVTNMYAMFAGCESLTYLDVSKFNTANVTDFSFIFWCCENLASLDVSNFDTRNVTNMAGMFYGCKSLTSLNVSNFNTANVTDMSGMFYNCTNLTSLDVKNFKTGNVTKMYAMFDGCESLTSLNVSNFNTANVTDMSFMFNHCENLASLNVSNFNTKNVTDMAGMFQLCSNLTSLDVSKFNTANVTDMSWMFYSCTNLTSLDVKNFKTGNVTKMYAMFYGCESLTSLNVSNFNTANVTDMSGMFNHCGNLTSLNVSNFNTANVTDMSFMFNLCGNLTSLDVSNFNTKNVTDMAGMFQLCSNLTSLDVSNFNTANVTDMSWMFFNCTNLTSLDVKNFKTGNVTKMYAMFCGCESLTSLNVSNFNTANVTNMSFMFNHCENLTSLDVSNFDTKNVTDMTAMFQHCSNLTSLNVSKFNTANVTGMSVMFNHCKNLTSLDVSKFNTANVTDMSGMFNYCENLTSLDVSKFNTANVTGMVGMFQCCSNLTSLDVSKFNTANVTDMSGMFNHCDNLTSLDVSKFNTANVTDMRVMFQCCSNLTSLDVSNFDTRNVTDMSWMFYDCKSLTSLNVSSFNTEKVINMCYMFYWCEKLTSLDVSNFDTRNVTDMRYMFFNCWNLNTLDVSNFIMAVCEDSECMFGYCDGLNSLAVSFTMENLNEDACAYVGYYEPCSIIAPDGFDFGVDTSGESFTWKSGYFKLGSGNTSILSFTVNGVSFKMVAVEGGTFMMGASDYDYEALSIDKPQHQVTLSSYYIGQVEVTQELWNAVMGTNPSHFKSSNKLPVECVSWDDCQRFIAKLNNLTGETFSLPTEAQWEFAARGGNNSNNYTYSGSNSLDFVAWYDDNSGGKTHNVANKVPNELGLYDMSGNVAEWCQDYLGDYNSNSQTNPSGPSSGSTRINRGGHWNSVPASCLVYKRKYAKPGDKYNSIGLRLVL